jgi:hypothetical protein
VTVITVVTVADFDCGMVRGGRQFIATKHTAAAHINGKKRGIYFLGNFRTKKGSSLNRLDPGWGRKKTHAPVRAWVLNSTSSDYLPGLS